MFARLIGTVCVLAMLANVGSAEFISVEFVQVNKVHWKGWVDTTRDELVVYQWETTNPRAYVPKLPIIAKAGTLGGEMWPGAWKTDPWDVPDDWDGIIGSEWGFWFDSNQLPSTEYGKAGWGMEIWSAAPNPEGGPATFYSEFELMTWPAPWEGNDGIVNYQADALVIDGDFRWRPRLTRIPGDANLDGVFDSQDFVQVFTAGLYETNLPAFWWEGDWNEDGVFDSGDFVVAFQAGMYEQPGHTSLVPEPSALVLASIGLLFLVRRK